MQRCRIALAAILAITAGACSDRVSGPGAEAAEYLLFLSTRGGALDPLQRPLRDIYHMDADGSSPHNLTSQPSYNYSHLSVSRDGRRVLFASDRAGCDIWRMNSDGSSLTRITGTVAGQGCNSWPRWSPDGARIAFASNREGRRVGTTIGLNDVYVMNADGSDQRSVSSAFTDSLGFNVYVLGWSPGGQIVFETNGVINGAMWRRVYVVNPDGTGLQPLFARLGDYSPAWSPDGSRIAFLSDRDGRSRLYVMNADGSGERSLTDHPGDDRLSSSNWGFSTTAFEISPWSPDGTRIAFERFHSPPDWGSIYTINADGTGLRRLTAFSGSFNGWSPSGGRIALTRRDHGQPYDVFVIDASGSNLRNLTNSPAEDTDAIWVRH